MILSRALPHWRIHDKFLLHPAILSARKGLVLDLRSCLAASKPKAIRLPQSCWRPLGSGNTSWGFGLSLRLDNNIQPPCRQECIKLILLLILVANSGFPLIHWRAFSTAFSVKRPRGKRGNWLIRLTRLIIAQAQVERLTVVTSDEHW